jgi:hypothetical protein
MNDVGYAGFRGLAHVHSKHSFDGYCDYAELRELFRGAGLHFACMTEHIEELDQARIDAIIGECRRHSDAEFLFVPGIEMDCFTIYFLGVAPTQVDFSDNLSIFNSLRRRARLLVLSHPIQARYTYPNWILDDCDAVEVMNAKHDGQFYLRPQSLRLLDAVRRSRPQVQGLIGMDFHHPRQMCPFHMRLTREGPLSEEFVLGELQQGRVAFFKGDVPLSDFGRLKRGLLRARIAAADAAHGVNSAMASRGLQLPPSLRRWFRILVEGR